MSILNDTRVLEEFKRSLITFFDELITQFPTEADLVIARIFLNDQVPIKDVMDAFNLKINMEDCLLKKMVKERNESFFLEYNVFDSLGQKDKINHFKRLWRSGNLDIEDKEVVWKWVESFVYLADKYAKVKGNTV